MWESIQYVTSTYALAAFALGALAVVLLQLMRRHAQLIGKARPKDRKGLIAGALGVAPIDTERLSQGGRQRLAEAQVQHRLERFKQIVRLLQYGVTLAFLAVTAAILYLPSSARPAREFNQVTEESVSGQILEKFFHLHRDGFLRTHGGPGVSPRPAEVWYQFFERGLMLYDLISQEALMLDFRSRTWTAFDKPEELINQHHVTLVNWAIMEEWLANTQTAEAVKYRRLVEDSRIIGGIGALFVREQLLETLGQPIHDEARINDAEFIQGKAYDLYIGLVHRPGDVHSGQEVRGVLALFPDGSFERFPIWL